MRPPTTLLLVQQGLQQRVLMVRSLRRTLQQLQQQLLHSAQRA
jgi:hypothetical protein